MMKALFLWTVIAAAALCHLAGSVVGQAKGRETRNRRKPRTAAVTLSRAEPHHLGNPDRSLEEASGNLFFSFLSNLIWFDFCAPVEGRSDQYQTRTMFFLFGWFHALFSGDKWGDCTGACADLCSDQRYELDAEKETCTCTPTTTENSNFFVGKTNCNDSGSGTSADEPFCSVQRGLDALRAGDTLTILDGVYSERVYLPFQQGAGTDPITIQGQSLSAVLDAGCPSFPCDPHSDDFQIDYINDGWKALIAGFYIGYGDNAETAQQANIVLDGFTVRNAPFYGIEIEATSSVTVRNMHIENAGSSLVAASKSSGFKLLESELNGANLGMVETEEIHGRCHTVAGKNVCHVQEAVTLSEVTDFEIAENHVHDGFTEGIDAKVQSRNGVIRNNLVERVCAVAIYINEAFDVEVYGNTVLDTAVVRNTMSTAGPISTSVEPCDAVLPFYGPGSGTGIYVAVGDVGDLNRGQLDNVKIYQNVVDGVKTVCIATWDEIRENNAGAGTIRNVEIYNNVMHDCSKGYPGGWGPAVDLDSSTVDAKIFNNIMVRSPDGISEPITAGPEATYSESHNLFSQYDDVPTGTGDMSADPMFVNAAGRDFHLQEGSPAIDNGTDAGLPFHGLAPDIGAFEHGL